MTPNPRSTEARPSLIKRTVFWLFNWRTARKAMFGLACLITLVVLFYTAENWRGKRAWELCKRDLEARGEKLVPSAFVPAPVPDDQNAMKIPLIASWFERFPKDTNGVARLRELSDLGKTIKFSRARRGKNIVIAELNLVSKPFPRMPASVSALADLEGASLRQALSGLTRVKLFSDPRDGLTLIVGPIPEPPIRININASELGTLTKRLQAIHLNVERTADTNVLHLIPQFGVPAEDMLAWFSQFDTEFSAFAEAAQRPHLRLDDDHTGPMALPSVLNFVSVRGLAQSLSARAKANLLAGTSDEALRDLTLIGRLMDFLEDQPALVSSMIQVAIAGLYVDVVADGLATGRWSETQCAAIQEHVAKMDLLKSVSRSLRYGERSGITSALEFYSRAQLARVFSAVGPRNPKVPPWMTPASLFVLIAPRGWIHQNQVYIARAYQEVLDALDLERDLVDPVKLDKAGASALQQFNRVTPYSYLAGKAVPNWTKALQTTAKNQTLLNQTAVACTLERYRHAHGKIPDSLAVLVPQFIQKLPHDIVNGQPLKYRRTDDGRFVLYSVGWNGQDDGGEVTFNKEGSVDFNSPDWVWLCPVK